MNQAETADELGVARDTINRYKQEFDNMTSEERALLIATLFDEQHRTLSRTER